MRTVAAHLRERGQVRFNRPAEADLFLSGLLAAPGSVLDLAAALRTLLANDSERKRLARNGPQRARELCEPRQQVQRLARVLADLTGRKV